MASERDIHVGLLRGINVGGKNTVAMRELKVVFEQVRMRSVRTYINSGNVVFATRARSRASLAARLEKAVAAHFDLDVKVLVRDLDGMRALVQAMPPDWVNDQTMKCDVLFLRDEVDEPEIIDVLTTRPGIDHVRYVPGAVLWMVDRKHVTRSGMARIVGNPVYQQVTVRNANTARKLLELMESTAGR